ncbi:hypothetical protein [Elizabethkingia anophelis]|uniref:hypothetical protein n=1 Tax=Elizabethkingia anophelis TaxID=1117645 RepID=UPI0038912DE6
MDKTSKKRKNYNTEILNVLSSRYGYSIDFIRKSLRGDRVGEMPDVLKKEYKILENESNEAIRTKAESLKQKI